MKKINRNVFLRYSIKYPFVALAAIAIAMIAMHDADVIEVSVRPGSIQVKIDTLNQQPCLIDQPSSKEKKA
jgi:hypothetical protein